MAILSPENVATPGGIDFFLSFSKKIKITPQYCTIVQLCGVIERFLVVGSHN